MANNIGTYSFSFSCYDLYIAFTFVWDNNIRIIQGTSAILGGLNSLPGAIVGGLILGIAESLAGGYVSIAFKNTFAFLVIILVLLIRPEGLLGKEFKERV